eukprot:Sdes_comp18968_c0_seq1m9497
MPSSFLDSWICDSESFGPFGHGHLFTECFQVFVLSSILPSLYIFLFGFWYFYHLKTIFLLFKTCRGNHPEPSESLLNSSTNARHHNVAYHTFPTCHSQDAKWKARFPTHCSQEKKYGPHITVYDQKYMYIKFSCIVLISFYYFVLFTYSIFENFPFYRIASPFLMFLSTAWSAYLLYYEKTQRIPFSTWILTFYYYMMFSACTLNVLIPSSKDQIPDFTSPIFLIFLVEAFLKLILCVLGTYCSFFSPPLKVYYQHESREIKAGWLSRILFFGSMIWPAKE